LRLELKGLAACSWGLKLALAACGWSLKLEPALHKSSEHGKMKRKSK